MSADRLAILAAAVDTLDGPWTTARAWRLYRAAGIAPGRRTARLDLAELARRGRLIPRRTAEGAIYYVHPTSLEGGDAR